MAPKRQRKVKNQVSKAKKRKCDTAKGSKEEAETSPPNTTKIVDINNDCLERIFNHLSLIDLLNVADANKQLKPAVDLSFAARYGRKWVHLRDIQPYQHQSIEVVSIDIWIYDLTTCLRFIRSFGHLISRLIIDYIGADATYCIDLDHYINEYCAETLTEIEIRRARKETMNRLQKPFSKVRILQFRDCDLGRHLTDFNKWFPQMWWLCFSGVNKVADRKCIEQHLPCLKMLNIDIQKQQRGCIGRSNVVEALRLNSHLISLTIGGDGWDAKFLQKVSKNLLLLESLEIRWTDNFSNLKNGTIHFKHVKQLNIHVGCSFSGQEIPRIPLSFDQLEKVTIYTIGCKLNDNFIEFIDHQPSLTALNLNQNYFKNFDPLKNVIDKLKLAKVLSTLTEMNLSCTFSVDEAIQFLDECKLLQKFRFILAKSSSFDALKDGLSKEWQSSVDYCRYIQLER